MNEDAVPPEESVKPTRNVAVATVGGQIIANTTAFASDLPGSNGRNKQELEENYEQSIR